MYILCLIVCFCFINVILSYSPTSFTIVGLAGSAAEGLAVKMGNEAKNSNRNCVVILDRPPYSPVLQTLISDKKIQCYFGTDFSNGELKEFRGSNSKTTLSKTIDGSYLIFVADNGSEDLRDISNIDEDTSMLNNMIDSCTQSLTSNTQGILIACSIAADKSQSGIRQLFSKPASSSFRTWCEEQSKPFSRLTFGQLTGGVPGAEPTPFIGLPTLEPELHPSVRYNGVVLTTSESDYASDEVCTRNALTESILLQTKRNENIDAMVMSIDGDSPTEKDWKQAFNRVSSGKTNVEVLRIDFEDIAKPQALQKWIVDTWFPQALIDADAATKLAGARPVRATVSPSNSNQINIMWEDLQPDLTTLKVGELQVTINCEDEKSITVKRIASEILPGEMQLMDKLVEGINKNVYKKKIASKL